MIGNQPGNRRPHRRLIGLALALGMVLAGNTPAVVAADEPPVDGGSGSAYKGDLAHYNNMIFSSDGATCNDDGSLDNWSPPSSSWDSTRYFAVDSGPYSDGRSNGLWDYVGTSVVGEGLHGPATIPVFGAGHLKLCGKIGSCDNVPLWDGKGSFDGIEGYFIGASDVDILFTDLSWGPDDPERLLLKASGRYTSTVTSLSGVQQPSESGTVVFTFVFKESHYCGRSPAIYYSGSFQLVKDPVSTG